MDYSQNFVKGMLGTQSYIMPQAPYNLYDLSAFGIKLPHPPSHPTKVPKDVLWWKRTNGGASANIDTGQPGGEDPTALILRILRSGGRP